MMWLLVLAALPVVFAQFRFFEQMFGQHQQQQQQHASGASQWTTQSENVPCTHYLCPTTLVCVHNPSECPCPNIEDIKCTIPDTEDKDAATVVCVRGEHECKGVERLMRLGTPTKK